MSIALFEQQPWNTFNINDKIPQNMWTIQKKKFRHARVQTNLVWDSSQIQIKDKMS